MSASARSNQVRACAHTDRPHSHGTREAYLADRCRCCACRDANTSVERARRRAKLYGRPGLSVDADLVRTHVRELEQSGIGTAQIAALAAISRATLSRLLWGVPSREIPPTSRLRRSTALRLLAITAHDDNLAGGSLIDATGTRRRAGTLISLGWTMSALARELERDPSNLRATLRRDTVTRDTARAVSTLYEKVTHQPAGGPYRNDADAADPGNARCWWSAPLAWDKVDHELDPDSQDHDTPVQEIDDLDIEIAIERVTSGRAVRLTDAERDELVLRLTVRGHSLQQIAGYLRVSPRTISRRRRALRAA